MPLDLTVYLVTDAPERYPGPILDHVAAAIEGGAAVVQYRDTRTAKGDLYRLAVALRALTRTRGVPLLINDHLDLALAVQAEGAHVGQGDIPVAAARRVLGPSRILGLSVTNLAELEAADLAQVDYLGVGPVFPTGSKTDAAPAMGLPVLATIAARSPKPVVAIGGITVARAREVRAAGAAGVAVISALAQAPDPAAAARALRTAMRA